MNITNNPIPVDTVPKTFSIKASISNLNLKIKKLALYIFSQICLFFNKISHCSFSATSNSSRQGIQSKSEVISEGPKSTQEINLYFKKEYASTEPKALTTRSKMSLNKLEQVLSEQNKKWMTTPDDGDCFYAAFAIVISHHLKKIVTLQDIRAIVKQKIDEVHQQNPGNNWIKRIKDKEFGAIDSYDHLREYVGIDAASSKSKGRDAIWGQAAIDGELLCEHFKVNLRLYEINMMDDEPSKKNDPNNYFTAEKGEEPVIPYNHLFRFNDLKKSFTECSPEEIKKSQDRLTIDVALYPGHFLGVVENN